MLKGMTHKVLGKNEGARWKSSSRESLFADRHNIYIITEGAFTEFILVFVAICVSYPCRNTQVYTKDNYERDLNEVSQAASCLE